MHATTAAPPASDPFTLIAAAWLASGCVLLGLTPLPLHDASYGWSPAFWLLAAPCVLLIARVACARWPLRGEAPRGYWKRPAGRRCATPSRALRAPQAIRRTRRGRDTRTTGGSAAPAARGQAAMPLRLASMRRISSRRMRR